MTFFIQILVVILLVLGIVAVIRLWSVLGSVRQTLANVEATRQRLDTTADTVDKLLREEVTPTLQVARATITNVEVTTRALAETTSALRRITGKAEAVTDARRLISAGSALAHLVARKPSGPAGKARIGSGRSLLGLAAGLGAKFVGLLTRTKQTAPPARRLPPPSSDTGSLPALPEEK